VSITYGIGMSRIESYHVCDIVKTRDPQTILGRDPSDTEDNGAIKRDASNADPLLQNLQPHDQVNTTSCMEFPGSNTSKHGPIALLARCFALEFNDVANILEFSLCFAHIFADFSSKSTEDVAPLIFTTNLDEPAR